MKHKLNRRKSKTASVAFGLLTGIVVTFLGALLLGILINGEMISSDWIKKGAGVIQFSASLAAAGTALITSEKNRLPISVGTSTAYFIILLAANALLFSGQYSGVAVTALLILGAGISMGLLSVGAGKKNKINRRKY